MKQNKVEKYNVRSPHQPDNYSMIASVVTLYNSLINHKLKHTFTLPGDPDSLGHWGHSALSPT